MQSPALSNWRSAVVENPRGFLCTISNACQGNVIRKSHHLLSGSWGMLPPEVIPAGSTVQFGVKSDQWLTPSCEGSVEYELPGRGVVTISWLNPFGFLRSHFVNFTFAPGSSGNVAGANVKGKSVLKSHAKGSLLEGKCSISFNTESLLSVSSGASSKRASIGPASAMAPAASLSVWRNRMLGYQRAMFLAVINNSDLTLELESSDVGLGSAWGQHPMPTLAPHQRCSVMVFTRSLAGTSGTLVWNVKDSDKRVLLIFSNPQHGPNMLQVQTADQFIVTTRMTDRCVSGAVAIFAKRSGPSDPLLNDEIEDMDWASVVNTSPEKVRVGGEDDASAVRIFSLACGLMPPAIGGGDPQRRAILLAEALKESRYTVICLQEVFWTAAQEIMKKALLPHFPYIIDRSGKVIYRWHEEAFGVGVAAGLFVASRSPIEFSGFYPFEVGIGSDSLASKGVLLVKIKQSNMYIAVTDMQSDPDGSIPWKLQGNSRAKASQARNGQIQMISRLFSQTITEREKKPAICGLVLAGITRVNAERRVRAEQEQWASSTLIPHLADLINAGKVPVVYAQELISELVSRGFQMRFLGPLRAAVTDRRSRSLLLVVMIARVLQQELWRLMREQVFADKMEEQKKYVDLCLRYFETISGFKSNGTMQQQRLSMSASAPSLGNSSELSSSGGEASRMGGSLSALPADAVSAAVLQQQQQQQQQQQRSHAHENTLIHGIFDKELVRQIHHLFGPHALDEATESHASYLCAEVSWFQLLRYVQHLFGVSLNTTTEVQLLKQGPRALEYPDDVANASMDVLQVNADWDASEKLQIERTEEFREMLQVLGNPRDAFREKNVNDFGSDATLEHAHQEEARRHQILVFDNLPDQKTELLRLRIVSCTRPLLMGDSGATTDLLSGVPGVEVVLKPTVEGFDLM